MAKYDGRGRSTPDKIKGRDARARLTRMGGPVDGPSGYKKGTKMHAAAKEREGYARNRNPFRDAFDNIQTAFRKSRDEKYK